MYISHAILSPCEHTFLGLTAYIWSVWSSELHQGPVSILHTHTDIYIYIYISVIKISRSIDCFIFVIGIPILIKQYLYSSAPRFRHSTVRKYGATCARGDHRLDLQIICIYSTLFLFFLFNMLSCHSMHAAHRSSIPLHSIQYSQHSSPHNSMNI